MNIIERFQQPLEKIDEIKFSTSVSDSYIHIILKDEVVEIILYAENKLTEDLFLKMITKHF